MAKYYADSFTICNGISDADITQLVSRFYELNCNDKLLAPFFASSRMTALRAKFAQFVVHGLTGQPMDHKRLRRIHRRLGVGTIEYAACARNLLVALGEQPRLETRLREQLLTLLWELEADIVTEDSDHDPLYMTAAASRLKAKSHDDDVCSETTSETDEGEVVYLDDLMMSAKVTPATPALGTSPVVPALAADFHEQAPKRRRHWRSILTGWIRR